MSKGYPESSAEDRALIVSEEGRVTFVYDDAISPPRKYIAGTKIKGNLTAGVGHLLSRGKAIFPEANSWIGETIPASVIDQWLDDDLDEIEAAAAKDKQFLALTPHQRGTVYSFGFNIGVGGYTGSSVRRDILSGRLDKVPADLAKWTKTKINGVRVTSKGLIKRRAMETAYWLGGAAPKADVNNNRPQATEIATPDPKKWSPTEIVGAGSTLASVAVAGFTVTEPVLVYTFAGILILVVLAVGALFVKRQFFTR